MRVQTQNTLCSIYKVCGLTLSFLQADRIAEPKNRRNLTKRVLIPVELRPVRRRVLFELAQCPRVDRLVS